MNFKSSLSTLLFGLSLLPLLAYPAVLVANVMQAAALADPSLRPQSEPSFSWKRAAMGALVLGTTAYPGVVLASRFWARAAPHNSERQLAWSAVPLGFLATFAVLVRLLSRAEAASRD